MRLSERYRLLLDGRIKAHTSALASKACSTMKLPMNPLAPVTKIFLLAKGIAGLIGGSFAFRPVHVVQS